MNTKPVHAWQIEHYMRNTAHSLDVLALEVRAHGAKGAADRLTAIAADMRKRAARIEQDNRR